MSEPVGPVAGAHRGSRRTRRVLRWALLVVVAVTVAGYAGLSTATVRGSVGPHEARYDVTTSGMIVLDLGPLGTVELDSPLPAGIGARIVVEEIPADVTALDQATTLAALEQDIASYLQFFTSPEIAAADAVRALISNAVLRTAGYLALGGVLTLAVLVLLGHARRSELARDLERHSRPIGALVALSLVGAIGLVSSDGGTTAPATGRTPSAIFAGTPLEGARITGRLAGLVDTYGGMAIEAWRESEAFYTGAATNLRTAWHSRELQVQAAEELGVPWGGSPAAGEDLTTAVVVSDLHCNVGMVPLITDLVDLTGATVILDGGDRMVNGTSVERYCVTALDEHLPAGVSLVAALGNHDSEITSETMRAAGTTVLDGSTVEVEGMRILGDTDPQQTRIGAGTSQVGPETAQEMGQRLAARACEDDVDLLLIHTPAVGSQGLYSGCVPVQVSGHLHTQSGPLRRGGGVLFISGTTAGAAQGAPTVGPLNGPASLAVLTFDRAERQFVSYRLVTVRPDASVFVAYPVAFPQPAGPDAIPEQHEPGP